ncbi:MAG: glycosyltransferase family 4 protein [Planctomycetota bacterium]
MRVLMVCPELPSENRPGSMAPALRQFESLRQLGVQVDTYDMRGTPIWKYLVALPKIRKLARDVDIVHAHFGFCGWLVYLATAWMSSRPKCIMSYMGDDLLGTPYNEDGDLERFSRLMIHLNKWLASKFDHVIVKSQEMQRILPTQATVVPNGVDLNAFTPIERGEARRMLGLPAQRLVALFPGNPENPRKGFMLAKSAIDVAAEQLGEPIEVLTLWRVTPEQVPLYMSASNVMTMTSLIEGSPNVVKEAMACDTPIASVRVGDTSELLSGVDGCCVCDRQASDLAEGISHAIRAGRSKGRDAIETRGLELTAIARRVLSIYHAAVGAMDSSSRSAESEDMDDRIGRLDEDIEVSESKRNSNSMEAV